VSAAAGAEPRSARLDSPFPVRGVRLPNRIVGAPMERNYCDLLGRVTPRYVDYLARRAAGGTGLLFTESCYVSQAAKARPHQMGLHGDHAIDGLARLAAAVHAEGARLGVELNHAGRVAPSAVSNLQPVAPSAVPCAEVAGELPRALTVAEIDQVVADFTAAAARAIQAGVDVIAVHGAHGYLIAQFLSPRSNHRTDEYREPTAFLNRVLAAVRAQAGETVPVFLRLSAFEGLPGGLDEERSLDLAGQMDLAAVDVVDISAGTYGAGQWITPSGEVAEGYLARTAQRYRRFGRPVSLAGRITTPAAAGRIVAEGLADLVVVGRALHADPDWARHAIRGTDPRPCISCNQGCTDVIHRGLPLWCAVNPETGYEGRWQPRARVPAAGRLLVIGGGPAGLEAAVTAAQSGLRVRLLERADRVGGQLRLAARLRSKPQFRRLLSWYEDQLARLEVEVRTGVTAPVDAFLSDVDAVVIATGGTGYLPPVPGSGHARVVEVRDWLRRRPEPTGRRVTVWGADRVGVAVADDLAGRGYEVLLVGAQPELAPDAGNREKLPAVERLGASPHVAIHLRTSVEAIGEADLTCGREGALFRLPNPGIVVASHGVLPAPVAIDHAAHRLAAGLVAVAGDALGAAATIDHATASGRAAATAVAAGLMGRPAAGLAGRPAGASEPTRQPAGPPAGRWEGSRAGSVP
jgi:2,4-dienoyl-CoA reductase-like NADH-dependent reductase (Old Yellow Enzyme family)/thioredoxin reductase